MPDAGPVRTRMSSSADARTRVRRRLSPDVCWGPSLVSSHKLADAYARMYPADTVTVVARYNLARRSASAA